MNLISNAIKFSRDGGAIFISGAQENGRIFVNVRDEGSGIRPEDLGHIFDNSIRAIPPGFRWATGSVWHWCIGLWS